MTPVILHHGLFGFGNLRFGPVSLRYFAGGIERAIGECGHPIVLGRVHPTGGIETRARQLKAAVLRQLRTLRRGQRLDRAVILAHSMGGLDARFMVTHMGMAEHISTVVTICTPHRGSSYADWVVTHLGERLRGAQLAALLGLDLRAISDLTKASVEQFNRQTPDHPDVRYFSVSASRPIGRVPPMFLHSQWIVEAAEGENDGLVSVHSARWGRHLDTWPVDHLHAINKRLTPGALRATGDMTPRYVHLLREALGAR